MHFLMHLLSHAVLDRHKKNLQEIKQRLHAHRMDHDKERKIHERLLFLQQQLRQATKVHLFRRDLLVGLQAVEEQKTRTRVQRLADKLQQIEQEEKQLSLQLAKKTKVHFELNQQLEQLEKKVDQVITAVGSSSKR